MRWWCSRQQYRRTPILPKSRGIAGAAVKVFESSGQETAYN
jgi:hypothetical protein